MRDHYQIWERAIGFRPELKKKYPNPFRADRHGDCYFEWVGNYLRLKDWGNSYYNGINCFDAVSIRVLGHKIDETGDPRENWNTVMDFISGVARFDKANIVASDDFKYSLIASPRDMTAEELVFYRQFGIKDIHLSDDHVTGCDWYKYNSRQYPDSFTLRYPSDLAYVLWMENDRKKVYRPSNKELKFTTDTLSDDVWSFGSGGMALVFEGHKDARVAYNLGFDSIGLQSCTIAPTKFTVMALKQRFSRIVYVGDWDNAGITNGSKVAEAMGIEQRVFPGAVRSKLLSKGLSDLSDLYREVGRERCIKALNYLMSL